MPIDSEGSQNGADGAQYRIREFVSPLPEKARDLPFLDIKVGLTKLIQYYYFDGQQAYTAFESEKVTPMRATVWRATSLVAEFVGEGTFLGHPVKAQVSASAVAATLTLTMENGVFPALPEDAWYSVHLRDERQVELRPKGGSDIETAVMVNDFDGTGQAPKELELQLRVDREEGVVLAPALDEKMLIKLTSK